MKPIPFDEQNVVFAENQPEYLPLPAFRTSEGEVVTCWELSDEEKEQVAKTGRVWHHVLTFNQPLQPLFLQADNPFEIPDTPGKV